MRPFLILMLAASLTDAAAAPAADHEAYVWQRRWTPELSTALTTQADVFAGYRVLAGELGGDGEIRVAADWASLRATRRPVTLVLRVPGREPRFAIRQAATMLRDTLAAARAQHVEVVGIELDHDCPRSQLSAYATQLRALRQQVDVPLHWSITALPDWLHSDDLTALVASVDSSVLQVHAVARPEQGLFDPVQALRWIRAYARITPRPFRVALPAYATRVSRDAGGRIIAIDSDGEPAPVFAPDARELVVDPRRVAVVLERLTAAPPPRFRGVAWFRLPLSSDRRSWRASTLRALIAGDDVALPAQVVLAPVGANFDVVLRNPQRIDVMAPQRIALPVGCTSGEGVAGYRFEFAPSRVTTSAPPLLKPGASRTIGWAACTGASPP